MTSYSRGPIRRRLLRSAHHATEYLGEHSLIAPLIGRLVNRHRPQLWIVPAPGPSVLRQLRAPRRPWRLEVPDVPVELRSQPGIKKDLALEATAMTQQPLFSFTGLHGPTYLPAIRGMWPAQLLTAPANARAMRKRIALNALPPPATAPVTATKEQITADLMAFSRDVGLSAVGITRYQEKYNYADYRGLNVGDTVIVCMLEQNYHSTQLIPSERSESTALATYGQLEDRVVRLASWLRDRGYAARPEGHVGESLALAYAVEAGLGQLGLNGQLLSPDAGSRARIHVLTTDADLVHGEPVDYGLEGVCDRCQICVQRCPAGAIPAARKEHRGVTKAKLNTKRCLPILGLAAGCGVCMKVCPVQRYGLTAVIEEYRSSGRILGKDSDDLEGYDWPVDGRHYGPGERPRVPAEVFDVMPDFDPYRTVPVARQNGTQSDGASRSFSTGLS